MHHNQYDYVPKGVRSPEYTNMPSPNASLYNDGNYAPAQRAFNNTPHIRPHSLLAKLAVPCQTVSDYDYGLCYSYYADGCYNTCQFVDGGDIEDFM